MITVKMTESEYKAYQLFLKSIGIFRKANHDDSVSSSLEKYLADPENIAEIESSLDDVKAGRITYIDVNQLWENIK